MIVLSSLADIQDRRLPGSSALSEIGDPAFDAFLVEQYENAVDVLSATGATVIWMTAPCTDLEADRGAVHSVRQRTHRPPRFRDHPDTGPPEA